MSNKKASHAGTRNWSDDPEIFLTGAYLYVLNDLGIQWVIVRVGWDFCCAVLEEIFLPGKKSKTAVVHVNNHSSSVAPWCVWKRLFTHHWCLSERPFQRGSVRTIRSMSFFHSIPSEMTLCHSLHTSSAEHRERASRKDKMFSAIWSKPWAEKGKKMKNSQGCFKTVDKASAG